LADAVRGSRSYRFMAASRFWNGRYWRRRQAGREIDLTDKHCDLTLQLTRCCLMSRLSTLRGANDWSSPSRDVSGNDATQALLQRLPSIFALQPDCQLLARMTVTPTNVSDLCTHVRSLYAIGFHRIVYQPAYEAGWTARSIDLYAREHSRIGTWLLGLRSLGKPQPEVQPWRSIVQRLRSDTRRSHCGAGINVLAVAPDGALYPCYRFATERGGEDYRLGDVGRGVTEAVRVEEFATLEPDRLQPQGVSCTDCSARDGCGHFCPATGVLLGEGLNSVPAVVCELIRAQVAAVRPYVELTARRPRTCGPATSTVVESMES
jgi:radical SAM protein with 4Fe4S-binding SPASM domain